MSGWKLCLIVIAVAGWALGIYVWWRFRREALTLLRQIRDALRER